MDERDKGDKFERLVLNLLRTEPPEWVSRFSDVWLWSEWPGRAGRPDTGVDLVAKLRDRDGYAAIQCKFYDPSHRVSKGDLDTFLSASGGVEFLTRYFFDTADDWNGNATETARHQAVPVQRVDLAYWTRRRSTGRSTPGRPRRFSSRWGERSCGSTRRRRSRRSTSGLATRDRGKMIRACGTGKTYTSLKIAERMVGAPAGGCWSSSRRSSCCRSRCVSGCRRPKVDIRPFAVCSDVRVGRKATDEGEISTIDLTEPATRDAETLVARMAAGKHATPRMDVVFPPTRAST